MRQGRLEEALQNLEALVALARMERDEYTLVAQMIRVAVAGLGLSVTWDALQAPGWTEPQLERLQRAWEPVDLVEAYKWGELSAKNPAHEFIVLFSGGSTRDAAILKMNADQIAEAHKRVAAFVPHQPQKSAQSALYARLVL